MTRAHIARQARKARREAEREHREWAMKEVDGRNSSERLAEEQPEAFGDQKPPPPSQRPKSWGEVKG